MPKYLINKNNGLYDISAFMQWLLSLPDGKYLVDCGAVHEKRSGKQNRYLWGLVYPMILRGLLDVGYDEITDTSQVHEMCKGLFTSKQAVNKKTGEILTINCSTSDMNTVEFDVYIDRIRDWSLEYLNIEIPEPDSNWNYGTYPQ